MKKIIVPTDFSENSTKAALYAAEIAIKTGAEILLVHALGLGHEKNFQPFTLHEKYNRTIMEADMEELAGFRQLLAANYPGLIITTAVYDGLPVDGILELSRKSDADLIVMGTKGATGLKELFLGSVTASVIGKTTIPVLAIPLEYELEEPDALLIATSHFEENTSLLQDTIELARLFSAIIHVVIFVDKKRANAVDYLSRTRELDDYLHFLKQKFPEIVFSKEVLEGKDFEEAIENYCEKNKVDIISMITYPKSLAEKILKKSVTKKMAYHSGIPILAIPQRYVQKPVNVHTLTEKPE